MPMALIKFDCLVHYNILQNHSRNTVVGFETMVEYGKSRADCPTFPLHVRAY